MSKSIVEWVWTDEDKSSSDGYVGLVGCYGVHKSSFSKKWLARFCSESLGCFETAEEAKRCCENHLPNVIDDIKDVDSTIRRMRQNERDHGI